MVSECSNINFTTEDQNQHAKTWPQDQAKHCRTLTWHMTWIYEKFLLQLDGYCHWPSQCHRWYAENKLVPAIPTVCDRKLQFGWLLTGGFPIPPGTWYLIPKEYMEFNIKGALLISTRWSNHGCFPSVLKCFADISCFTLQPFEKGWQTKVPRSYWAKQKYGKNQNLTCLKLLDRISCLVQLLL